MEKKRKFWVKFLAPGFLVGEDWIEELDGFEDPDDVEWPDGAYAFTMHQRDDVVDDDGVEFKGEPKQTGPVYYHPDSKIESLAEVAKNPQATKMLLDNMRCNEWTHVVWTRWGNWPQCFDPKKTTVLKRIHTYTVSAKERSAK
ncbi:MAG: hypothetical protein Q8K86_08335 [Candidatus Nanopelagicaceae bacterium]|nr:hypothetical protein [Candidatus Nanopelagicaceae bacterium]